MSAPLYAQVDFARQPRVLRARIARGFVTRARAEETWEETLLQLPDGLELEEPNNVRHYILSADGLYHEFYGAMAPTNRPVFVAASEFDPALLAQRPNPLALLHLYDLDQLTPENPASKVRCPACDALTDHLPAHGKELHLCRNIACQHVFAVVPA